MKTNPKIRLENAGKKSFPKGFAVLFRGGKTLEQLCVFLWKADHPDMRTSSVDYADGTLELQYVRDSEVSACETQELFLLAAETLHRESLLKIATTLHRHTCQSLTAAKLEIDLMRLNEPDSEELTRVHEVVSGAVRQVREIMESLPAENAENAENQELE